MMPYYSYICKKCKKTFDFMHDYGQWKKQCECGGVLVKQLSAPSIAKITRPAHGRFCPETQFRDWCRDPLTPEKDLQGKGKFKMKPKKRKELI